MDSENEALLHELVRIQQQVDSIQLILENIYGFMLSHVPEEKEKWEPTAYEYGTPPQGKGE